MPLPLPYGTPGPGNTSGYGSFGGGANRNYPPRENSNGPALYNEDAGKILDFSYWGAYASVGILTVPIGSAMDWNARRNPAAKIQCTLSYGSLSDLWDVCEEVMESLRNTGTFTSTAIVLGQRRDQIIEINNGSTIDQPAGIYLVVYKAVDPDGRAGTMDFYPFDAVKVIRSYDRTGGAGLKEEISKFGQFKKFYRAVKEACKAFTMAQAHVIKHATQNDRLSQYQALAAIANKLGVDIAAEFRNLQPMNNGYGGGGGHRNGLSAATHTYGGPNYKLPPDATPIATLDMPIDLNMSMDSLRDVDPTRFK